MKKKAIIISIKGIKLSKKEKLLLSKEKPWGLILFKRNIKSFYQVKNLEKFYSRVSLALYTHLRIIIIEILA